MSGSYKAEMDVEGGWPERPFGNRSKAGSTLNIHLDPPSDRERSHRLAR
jgi:hypothetical protein